MNTYTTDHESPFWLTLKMTVIVLSIMLLLGWAITVVSEWLNGQDTLVNILLSHLSQAAKLARRIW